MDLLDEARRARLDETLGTWQQADCTLGNHRFLFRLDTEAPLTEPAAVAAADHADTAEEDVRGFTVVTQTCDIVRGCSDRPFVQLSPLVEVSASTLHEVERGRRPRYAFVPALAARNLVADLDRVMTVEKALMAGWTRVAGVRNESDARRFRFSLTRNRARAAFPDDFVRLIAELTRRLSAKHDAESDEGRALRALREIRIRAEPSWSAEEIQVMFWFIRDENSPSFEGSSWDNYREQWLRRVPTTRRFNRIDGAVQTLDDLTAREYVESDPLDFDHLSVRGT